jgi:glycosyltransferase involved in cell wall biosynthesis
MADLRIATATIGDPTDPTTQSGVAKHLIDALANQAEVALRVDTTLKPVQRAVVTVSAFRPDRDVWRRHIHRSPHAAGLRARIVDRAVASTGGIDYVVPVRGTYLPLRAPYSPYIDNSVPMVREHWRQWAPWRGRYLDRVIATERAYLTGAAHVFTAGQPVADSIVDAYALAPERVTVVAGGSHFPVVELDPAAREKMVLFIGYDFTRKGGEELLAAFAIARDAVPDSRLVIVGPTVAAAGNGVQVLGPVTDRTQLAELLSRASVFALPARYEPFGMALLEAMAHGVPCVGTDVGAIPDIIRDGVTGRVVPRGDVNALGDAFVQLLTDPSLVDAFGRAGQARVRDELNWPAVAKRILDVLRDRPAPR